MLQESKKDKTLHAGLTQAAPQRRQGSSLGPEGQGLFGQAHSRLVLAVRWSRGKQGRLGRPHWPDDVQLWRNSLGPQVQVHRQGGGGSLALGSGRAVTLT